MVHCLYHHLLHAWSGVLLKYADLGSNALDVSASNFLAALRLANEIVYVKKQMAGDPMAYPLGDVVAQLDSLHVEHINYAKHDTKLHVRILGREYWYTIPSRTEVCRR